MINLSKHPNNQGSLLIVSILIIFILGIIGLATITITNTELMISRNEKLSQKSFYMAESGIEHAKTEILVDEDNFPMNGSMSSGEGSYVVTCSSPQVIQNATMNSSEWIVKQYCLNSTGRYENAQKKIQVVLLKKSIPVNADAALGIYTGKANATTETTLQGSPSINGDDFGLPSDFNCSGVGCNVPLGSDVNGTEGLYFEKTNYDLKVQKEDQLNPYPEKVGNGTYSNEYWQDLAANLTPLADSTYNSTVSDQTLGTRDVPEISVLESNSTLSGTVNGAGILIVDGNVRCTGNFHFEGQVIILSNTSDVKLFTAGTPYIYGSVVVAGSENPEINIKGNANIKYSQKALENANNMSKFLEVVSWKEI